MSTLIRFLIPGCALILLFFSFEMSAQCGMTVDIQADPPPPYNLCPGETIALTTTVTGGTGPYTYLWSDGSIAPDIIIIPPYYGSVIVIVTDATGCVAYGQIHIKAWVWTVEIVYNPSSICQGDSVGLFAWPDFPDGTTFLWSTGETTNPIYVVSSGTFSLTVTDPNGQCTASTTQSVYVTYWPLIEPNISGPTGLCSGQTATLTAQGNPEDFYIWSTGEETSSIIISTPGVYWVTVSNWQGCSGIDSIEVLPGAAEPDISAPVILCSGQDGTIEITNADSFIDFLWNNGETTSSIIINTSGTYSVTVTANGGCTATGSVIIDSGSSDMNVSGTATPVTSCISSNGAVDLTVSPPGTYSFDWSNGDDTEDIDNLSLGSYTVTVTDAGGCTSSSTFEVILNTTIPSILSNITDATCGQNNGAIDLTVTPPSGTFTYSWSNGATTQDLTNIGEGTYSVTVTLVPSGCTAISTIIVTNFNDPPNITGNTTSVTSCTLANGSVDITISPLGTYSFNWSNGASTEDLQNIAAGNYTVTVTSSANCTATATFTVSDNLLIPVLNAIPTPATCGQNNGALDLSVTPAGTYTYLWSNGTTTEDLSVISGGTYSVMVTSGSNGCTATLDAVLPDNPITITISGTVSPNTLCIGDNGAIDISVNPSATYTYLWSNGATTQDLNTIPAGSYTITVTLGSTCIETGTFIVINNNTTIDLTGLASPNTSCTDPNGTIDIDVSPAGSYTYLWSNGESSEDLQQLAGGIYSVTVTGSDGCTTTDLFEVVNSNSNYSLDGSVTPNGSCDFPNGTIDIIISPAGTYTYDWSNGASTEDLQDLTSGTYGVTVTDINDCSTVAVFSIADTLTYPEISALLTPATCGGNNGEIDISVTPTNNNVFSWSNGSTIEDQAGLSVGNYSVTVTGANGCFSVDTFSIADQNSNFILAAVPTPNSSCLNPNGAIDLSILPPGSYSFLWSNAETSEDLQSIDAGSYAVTVTDSLSCTSSDTFMVVSNISVPILSANIIPATCGANNGSIDLTVVPIGAHTFLWSNGGINEDLQNIFPGSYSVIVTDTNGCQALDTFNIQNSNVNFTISAVPVSNTSCSSPNGSLDLTIDPAGTYTYTWSNGTNSEDLINLTAGLFTVTVTDNSSCSSTATFVIGNNTPVVTIAAIISPTMCGLDNGGIELTVIPSSGNTFMWSNGAVSEDLQNLSPGDYSLTVTGLNGCSTVDTFTVPGLGSVISLSGVPAANTNCISPNGTLDLSISPVGVYTIEWSNGNALEDQAELPPGIYAVTVSDLNGCSSTAFFIVEDQTIQPLITENISPSTCGQNNGQIDIRISPPGNYVFTWSSGDTIEDLQSIPSGTYSVTVTGENDCTTSATLMVANINTNFSISATTTDNTSCTIYNGSINLTVVPSGTYTFSWSNGATSEDIQNLPADIYTVTVTDISSCSTSGMYILDNSIVDLIVEEVVTPAVCGEVDGSIDLTVTPPSGNTFIWSDGTITEDLENILPGLYSVTITAQNGCTWSSGFNVPGGENIEIQIEANAINNGDEFVTIGARINLPLSALDTIMWFPESLFNCMQEFCLEQTISRPSQQTEIRVMVVDTSGCMAEARLLLDADINPSVYIPNVFSPNGDGANDVFTIFANPDVEEVTDLRIFDRCGEFVFQNQHFPPNDFDYGWDGGFRDRIMDPAVFVYWARVRFVDGSEEFYKGDVTLVR